MIPTYQPVQTGDNFGECYRCCVASVLNMTRESVPHFHDQKSGTEITSETNRRIREWFSIQGAYYVEFGFRLSMDDLLHAMGESHPGLHYLLMGRTARGGVHAVVACGDRIVHDPASPGGHILTGPLSDGHYRIGIIAKYV